MALSTVVLNYITGLLYPNRRGFSRPDWANSVRCVIDQGGAEVKNSVPLFVFPTKAPGGGNPPPALRGFVGNFILRGRKPDEEKIIIPCAGLGSGP